MQRKKFEKSFVWDIKDGQSITPKRYDSEKFELINNDIFSVWHLQLEDTGRFYTARYGGKLCFNLYIMLHQLNKPDIKAKYNLLIKKTKNDPPKIEKTFTGELLFVNDFGSSNSKEISIEFNTNTPVGYTIICEITILEAGTYGFIDDVQNMRLLARDLSTLMNNEEFSDVVLVSQDEQKFRAHRCVLVARSPVFAAMFKPSWNEGRNGVVKIDDLDGEHLGRLLNYVYAGKFENNEKDDIKIAGNLLAAADKYAIESLKANCAEVLRERLSVDNVLDVHILADAHRASGLKEQTMDFIVKHPEVIDSPKFLEAEETNPQLVNQILRHKWRKNV